MGLFSRAILERIIEENGHSNCHYCKLPTRINYRGGRLDRDHATVDHKIPKARGGTNAAENLVLACNACNNAKGDRSYEDFVARPYVLPRVMVPIVYCPHEIPRIGVRSGKSARKSRGKWLQTICIPASLGPHRTRPRSWNRTQNATLSNSLNRIFGAVFQGRAGPSTQQGSFT